MKHKVMTNEPDVPGNQFTVKTEEKARKGGPPDSIPSRRGQ